MHVGHRVGKSLSEERLHLLKNSRVNRRGGCIIQVDYSLHCIPPVASVPVHLRRPRAETAEIRWTSCLASGLQNPLRLAFDKQYNPCDTRYPHASCIISIHRELPSLHHEEIIVKRAGVGNSEEAPQEEVWRGVEPASTVHL